MRVFVHPQYCSLKGAPQSVMAGAFSEYVLVEDVVVVDIVDWRLDVAKKMGAITYNNSNGDLADWLMDKYGYDLIGYGTKAARVDAYIDAAGAPNIIPDTLKIANMKSRIVVVAMYKNGITVEPNDIMLSEAQIKGSCAYLHEDIYEVIDNLKKGVGCMTYILFI